MEPTWADAPTVTAEHLGSGMVTVSWEPAVATEVYRVVEIIDGAYTNTKTVTDGSTSVTYKNLSVGTHTFAVQPRKVIDGVTKYGTYSDFVTVEVTLNWRDAPVVTVSQTADGEVTVTWEPVVAVDVYRVAEVIDGYYKNFIDITDGKTTVVYSNVSAGTHYYAVQPRMIVDGATKYGTYSLPTVVEVINTEVPEIIAVTADSDVIEVGNTVSWTVEAEKGVEPYTYSFTLSLVGESEDTVKAELTTEEANVFTHTFEEEGTYKLSITVSGADGNVSDIYDTVFTVTMPEILYRINAAGNGVILVSYNGNDAEVIIPDTVNNLPIVEIGAFAFENNTTLEYIDLPDTVEVIGERAFAGCTNLSSMD